MKLPFWEDQKKTKHVGCLVILITGYIVSAGGEGTFLKKIIFITGYITGTMSWAPALKENSRFI